MNILYLALSDNASYRLTVIAYNVSNIRGNFSPSKCMCHTVMIYLSVRMYPTASSHIMMCHIIMIISHCFNQNCDKLHHCGHTVSSFINLYAMVTLHHNKLIRLYHIVSHCVTLCYTVSTYTTLYCFTLKCMLLYPS